MGRANAQRKDKDDKDPKDLKDAKDAREEDENGTRYKGSIENDLRMRPLYWRLWRP